MAGSGTRRPAADGVVAGACALILLLLNVHQAAGQTQCSATQICANNLCCSQFQFCGTTADYCGPGNCISGPCTTAAGSGSGSGSVGSIITESIYKQIFLHTNDASCPAANFYTYTNFINAAALFPGFGTVGDATTQKRELAAFLAQASHETTGGWATAPDGPYAWGLCYKQEVNCLTYCDASNTQWPCASGKSYCGRGPFQITWNYNYGPAGQAIGSNLLATPELVATDGGISWKTAVWFWMTAQSPKPSAHAVMVGQWTPSAADQAAGRLPGFGLTTDIINGGVECGHGTDARVQDRIGFYKRYCDILGVPYGDNLDCGSMSPY